MSGMFWIALEQRNSKMGLINYVISTGRKFTTFNKDRVEKSVHTAGTLYNDIRLPLRQP